MYDHQQCDNLLFKICHTTAKTILCLVISCVFTSCIIEIKNRIITSSSSPNNNLKTRYSIQHYNLLHKSPYTNLQARLLSATVCTYGIEFDPTNNNEVLFKPSIRYMHAAGFDLNHTFQSSPVIIQHGINGIHAALVSTTSDGVVVAFRGTISYSKEHSLLDWLHDSFAIPISVPGIKGKVHAGVYHAVKLMMEPQTQYSSLIWSYFIPYYYKHHNKRKRKQNYIKYQIKHQYQKSPIKKIYIVGHSKGGAMASIAAQLLINDDAFMKNNNIPYPIVYTFGSTKPGDTIFKINYEQRIQQYSYENYFDPIPFFPPSNDQLSLFEYELNKYISSINTTSNRLNPKVTKIMKGLHFLKGKFETVGKRICVLPNNTNTTISRPSNNNTTVFDCSTKDDNIRIKDISKKLVQDGKTFFFAHLPSCRTEFGYMHGVCEDVCMHYYPNPPP